MLLLVTVPNMTGSAGAGPQEVELLDSPMAEPGMGLFDRMGTWPSNIRPADCDIMYLPGEIVIFARNTNSMSTGPIRVWSYFEMNDTWEERPATGPTPDVRASFPGFAADPENQRAFFFGGRIGNSNYQAGLYIYYHNNLTWTQPMADGEPAARYQSGMVHDVERDIVWLFGGRFGQNSWSNLLYSYSTDLGWTRHDPSTKPSGRDEPCVVIAGDRLYTALGQVGSNWANDLWYFNITTGLWTRVTAALGLRTHAGGVMAMDPASNRLVVAMGYNYHSGYQGWYEYLNHTYLIDPETGSVQRAYLDPMIRPRAVRAWTITGGEILIFGGSRSERDVWRIDISSLALRGVPPSTYNARGTSYTAFDPDDGGKLLTITYRSEYIGDGPNYVSWMATYYSLSNELWHIIPLSEQDLPVHRSGMAHSYDHVDDRFYLYGGHQSYTVGSGPGAQTHYYFYDSMWMLDLKTGDWSLVHENSVPGPLSRASMVVDHSSDHRQIYLFGGHSPAGQSDGISVFNVTNRIWTKLNPPVRPNARYNTKLAMNPNLNGFYMFGGRDNSSNVYNDLWFFHTGLRRWEQMSGAQNPPSTRYDHGICVNTDTDEVIVFGGNVQEFANVYIYRPGWKEWLHLTDNIFPTNWESHGQAYDPATKMMYIWKGPSDQTEVWSYAPVLRTICEQGAIVGPEGQRIVEVFPTYKDYVLNFSGYSDLHIDDLLGMEIAFLTSDDIVNITWMKGEPLVIWGNTSWALFDKDPVLYTYGKGRWSLEIPIEFTFEAPEGVTVTMTFLPMTNRAYTEQRQAVNSFTMNSKITVSRISFGSELQPLVEPGQWLFGRTDLWLSGFQLSFLADSNVQPASGSFTVSFANQGGLESVLSYDPDVISNMSVPIAGEDGGMSYYHVNVTDEFGTMVSSQTFGFKLDLDPPMPPYNVSFRADSFDDPIRGIDNDQDVFFAWDSVFDGGAGIKGVCYSQNINLWPRVVNLTTEFKKMRLAEGKHTFYVWSVDNADRVGPYVEVPIIIDMHKPRFFAPSPTDEITVWEATHPVSIKVYDELSGVNPASIEYRRTGADRQFSDWQRVGEGISEEDGVYTIKMEIELHDKVKNLVQFRANDMARYGIEESPVISILRDSSLGIPSIELISPAANAAVQGSVVMSWRGNFINASELTYTLTVVDPLNGTRVIDAGDSTSFTYAPSYPGMYTWKVTASARGNSTDSVLRSFSFDPPFPQITAPNGLKVKQNETFTAAFIVKSTLPVAVNLTFGNGNLHGMRISGVSTFMIGPGEETEITLKINASTALPGDSVLRFNVTDDFGRWNIVQMTVTVERSEVNGERPNGGEKGFPWWIIVVAVVILIVVIAVVLFLLKRKRDSVFSLKVEPRDEEDAPLDLSYDPTGVIASGSAKSVGVSEYESLQRGASSNVMELAVPSQEAPSEE